MHPQLLKDILALCHRRAEQGDDPQERAPSPEVLEDALMALDAQMDDWRWLREQFWHTSELFVVRGGRNVVRLGTDCPRGWRLDEAIAELRAKERTS